MSDETLEKKDKLKLFISKIKENSKLLASAFLPESIRHIQGKATELLFCFTLGVWVESDPLQEVNHGEDQIRRLARTRT